MLHSQYILVLILFILFMIYKIEILFSNSILIDSFYTNNKILNLVIVDNDPKREKGLMFVKKMLSNEGMLFDYKIDGYYSVWMKNTFIPLDVLFLDSQYKIIDYVENTSPHNLDSISIGKKSRYIVELNGGTANKMNLKKGKKLNFKIIKKLS